MNDSKNVLLCSTIDESYSYFCFLVYLQLDTISLVFVMHSSKPPIAVVQPVVIGPVDAFAVLEYLGLSISILGVVSGRYKKKSSPTCTADTSILQSA